MWMEACIYWLFCELINLLIIILINFTKTNNNLTPQKATKLKAFDF